MERKVFLDKLEIVRPALSESDMIPVMQHFWLTGETLMAYNGQVAISVPLKTDLVGAVPGVVLLSLIKSSMAKDVELIVAEKDPGHVVVKAASTKLTLGLLSSDDFIFDMPGKAATKIPIKSDEQFLACIETCMRSVGNDVTLPDQMGITLIPDDGVLVAYSTNNATMSRAEIALNKGQSIKDRVILPTLFCEQLLKLGKKAKDLHLEIGKDHALFVAGKTTVFCQLIASEMPFDFDAILDHHYPQALDKQMVQMPTKLRLMLERAIIITDDQRERADTAITVSKGTMKFASRTGRGEVLDSVILEPQHPDVAAKVDARLLKAGYGFFDKFIVTRECAIMTKGHMVYLVSASVA